ncbi:Major facilitator superfamily domain containing protein [Tylopilus felleus]
MSSEPSVLKSSAEKTFQLPDNFEEKPGSGSFDATNGDEALQLFNRKLRRKLDLVIPTISAAVYFTQYLIMGFPIVGENYNLVSMAFYLGYLFWEFPTVLAKYLGETAVPIVMLRASTNSFAVFFALRFLLGMCQCESCVAPCLILIISMFYKKDEQATRISWFYVMNGLTQVFGGFIAYGVSFYDGKAIPTYKIIYLLLGGLAIVVGIIVLIGLPDSPERIATLERVRNDQGGTENKTIKMEQIKEALTDMIVLSTVLTSIPNRALSNFSNIIIKSFGYTSKQTLILFTPADPIGSAMVLFCGWYSDKKNERMTPIVIALVPTIVGAAIMIGLQDAGHQGALLFGMLSSSSRIARLLTCFLASYLIGTNTSGHTKKVMINGMTLATFSVGNIIGTEIFQPKDAPAYIPGKTAIMVLLIVQLVVQRQKTLAEEKVRRGWSDGDVQRERERHAFADLTDKQNLFFVYTA